ncbi:AMP-binding protein [bacterium]|nr:AMP-binding protein [bacterium]
MTTDNPYFVDESRPWFAEGAGWPAEVPKNATFVHKPLGQVLRDTTREHPEQDAVWFQGVRMKYRELDEMSDRVATGLANLGFKKGDVIALLLPNSFQYVVCYYACMRLGVIVSGCNPTYKPGEVLHQLNTIGAKGMVVLDILYDPIVAPIREKSPVKIYVKTNITDMMKLSPIKKTLGGLLGKIPKADVPNAKDFTQLMKSPASPPKVDIDPDDVATYIMTGGTTGVPKAAMLSHFNIVANSDQAALWLFKMRAGAAILGILPLFHSFAHTCVMNMCVRLGMMQILFPKPPDMDDLCKTIVEVGPPKGTMFPGAEILFKKVAEFDGIGNYDLKGKLSLCVSGAGPLHRPVQEAFEAKTGAKLAEGYGLTETSPIVSAHAFWGESMIGTIGMPVPGTDWRIVDAGDPKITIEPGTMEQDANGEQKPKSGEIIVAGPQVMLGYLNRKEDTDDTIVEMDGKRWLLTGDIGFMDEKGRITINDRKKMLIKNKGWSVFPSEVETLLLGHEAVTDVAVSGLPDDENPPECIKAWVVVAPDKKGKVSENDILKWAKENITFYKVPKHVEIIDEVPKNAIGKVMRRELQEADPIYKAWKEKQGQKKSA